MKNLMRKTRTLAPILILVTVIALQSPTLPSAFAHQVWYVAKTPTGSGLPGGQCSKPGFNTISAAISTAGPGDTIFVCKGTFTEQLTISESLTIESPYGPGLTRIQAPPTMTPDSLGQMDIVTVTGSSTLATLSGLNITGPVNVPCNTGVSGLGVFVQNGAFATITGDVIEHIHNTPIVQCEAYGVGILVGRQALSTVASAQIVNSKILDYQKGGIVVDNTGSTATISGNTITGWGLTVQTQNNLQIAQNGIQVSSGAMATIKSNSITNNECLVDNVNCGPDFTSATESQATGILLYSAGAGTTISGNTISNNDVGISIVSSGGIVIKSNGLYNNRDAAVVGQDGNYVLTGNFLHGPGNVAMVSLAVTVNTSIDAVGNNIAGYAIQNESIATGTLTASVAVS